jgi:hypothetical protein
MICSACHEYIRNGQRYEERAIERQSAAAVTIVLHLDPSDCPAMPTPAEPSGL